MVIRRVTAPVMPQASETARPSGAAFGNSAEVTSSPSANPKSTVSQIGIPLTAENARREKFAPSTPRSRPGCAVLSCSAPPGRLAAGGSLALENEPLPGPAACGHTLAPRDSPISPGLARSTTTSRVSEIVRPPGSVLATILYVPGEREWRPTRLPSRTWLTPGWPWTWNRPMRRQFGAIRMTTNSTTAAAQHEDERRPSLLVRSAPGDPVAGQPEPIHASRARCGPPALTGAAGALSAGAPCTSAGRCHRTSAAAARPTPADSGWRMHGRQRHAGDGWRRRNLRRLRHGRRHGDRRHRHRGHRHRWDCHRGERDRGRRNGRQTRGCRRGPSGDEPGEHQGELDGPTSQ